MTRPLSLTLIAVIAVTLAGCGIHDPYLSASATTASTARVSSTTGPSVTRSGPTPAADPDDTDPDDTDPDDTDPAPDTPRMATPGAVGSPHNVAYKFALAYTNISAAKLTPRLRTLTSLATRDYAQKLHSSAAKSALQVLRGLPPGGRMVAQIIDIELSARQGSFEHGTVTLQQALVQPGKADEQPFASTYVLDLLQSRGTWRVADFGAQP